MKPGIWIASAAICLAMGCGSKTVYKDDEGNEVSISGDGKSVKVESADGSGEMEMDESGKFEIRDDKGNVISSGTGTVTEEQLGVRFYPGSKELTASTATQANGATSYISIRESKDSSEKVREFYKSALGAPTTSVSAGDSYYDTWDRPGRSVTITVAKIEGRTEITITSTAKK